MVTTIAPWAELVSGTERPLTADKLLRRPGRREVDVWRSGSDEPIATLKSADQLAAPDLLPGFTVPVAELFA